MERFEALRGWLREKWKGIVATVVGLVVSLFGVYLLSPPPSSEVYVDLIGGVVVVAGSIVLLWGLMELT